MKSEELQGATASEPLTLEEEYAMQRNWREDVDSEERDPGLGWQWEGRLQRQPPGSLPFFPAVALQRHRRP